MNDPVSGIHDLPCFCERNSIIFLGKTMYSLPDDFEMRATAQRVIMGNTNLAFKKSASINFLSSSSNELPCP